MSSTTLLIELSGGVALEKSMDSGVIKIGAGIACLARARNFMLISVGSGEYVVV